MAGIPPGRRLIWIPVVLALGATTLTGCKKTIHAVKPLTNVSQVATATASSSASPAASTTAAVLPPVTSGPSSASAAPASASVSQTAATAPATSASAKAGSGCALIPLSSVAKALGVASIASVTQAPTTLHSPIIAHQGCRYVAGSVGAGWDDNTYIPGSAPSQALIAVLISKIPGAKQTTISGLVAYTAAIQLPTGIQEQVGLYKGDQAVAIVSHGKSGASVALAQLIAAAI